jgi:hypothetical protein
MNNFEHHQILLCLTLAAEDCYDTRVMRSCDFEAWLKEDWGTTVAGVSEPKDVPVFNYTLKGAVVVTDSKGRDHILCCAGSDLLDDLTVNPVSFEELTDAARAIHTDVWSSCPEELRGDLLQQAYSLIG